MDKSQAREYLQESAPFIVEQWDEGRWTIGPADKKKPFLAVCSDRGQAEVIVDLLNEWARE